MKKNTLFKILTLCLILTFIFGCLPIATLAAPSEATNSANNSDGTSTIGNTSTEVINKKVTELSALRTETTKHFKLTDGTYQVVYYGVPVHRKDSNGIWQDIDNSLYLVTKNGASNLKTHDNRAKFSKEFAFGEPVFSLNENGYSISMSLISNGSSSSNAAKIDATDEVLLKSSSKVTNSISRDSSQGWNTIEEASTINNKTSIMYENILPSIDLEYILVNNKVKENIIVKGRQDSYVYEFNLVTDGLYAELDFQGNIKLYDFVTKEPKYTIPAPYMYDRNGDVSYNVNYTLSTNTDGAYKLVVSADAEWINSAERAFPVTIDPTLAPDYAVYDAYVTSSSPKDNYGMTTYMQVNSTSTALIYIDMYNLPQGATVTSAYLYLPFYHTNAAQSSYTSVNAYRVLSSWDETSVTYATMPTLRTSYSDNSYFVASSSNSVSSPGETSFYIKSEVVDWLANPSSNFGLAFKYQSGNTTLRFLAYENGNAYPSLRVNYSYKLQDGIYAFKSNYYSNNWLSLGTNNGTNYIRNITSTTSPVNSFERTQLFKITHVSDDRYIIRSMHNNVLSFGISGSNIVVKNIAGSDNSVATADTILIEWDGLGFILRPYGSSYCISAASTSQLSVVSANSATSRARWTFVKCTPATNADNDYNINISNPYYVGKSATFQPNSWTTVVGANQPIMQAQANDSTAFTQSWNTATNTYTIAFHKDCDITLTLSYNGVVIDTYTLTIELPAEEGATFIRSQINNEYLQMNIQESERPLVLDALSGEEYQSWSLEHLVDGYYKITSPYNGLSLSVQSEYTNEISEIVLAEYTGASTQQWKLSLGYLKTLTPKSSEANSGNWYMTAVESNTSTGEYSIRQSNTTISFENQWCVIPEIAVSGSTFEYNSNYWNAISSSNNCYSYAINNPATSGSTQQPGASAGISVIPDIDEYGHYNYSQYAIDIIAAVKADFMVYFNANEQTLTNYIREVDKDEICPSGTYKIAFAVGGDGTYIDYHFYRQDSSGFWSHKRGTSPVTNVDSNNSLLPNPEYVVDDYWVCGYYIITPWKSESNLANDLDTYSSNNNTISNDVILEIALLSFSKSRQPRR